MSNVSVLHFVLAAPEDVDKWMNILFVVILAVFWVLRGLFREKIKDSESKPGNQQQPSRKPVQKSSERARALWENFLDQARQPFESESQKKERSNASQQQTKTSVSKPVFHKPSTVSEQSISSRIPEYSVKPNLSIQTPDIIRTKSDIPDIVSDIQAFSDSSAKTVKDLEDKPVRIRSKISEDDYISEHLLDYADPEELRRAILHYEILGKPLSLRSQSDSF